MEIFENEVEFQKMQHQNKFPKYDSQKGISSIFAYLFSILIWIGILIVGLVVLYTYWFSRNLVCLLQLIHPKTYVIPFWFALILVLLPITFPFTLLVVLLATLVKIIKS